MADVPRGGRFKLILRFKLVCDSDLDPSLAAVVAWASTDPAPPRMLGAPGLLAGLSGVAARRRASA